MGYFLKLGNYYAKKDGRLETTLTSYGPRYESGVKLVLTQEEATEFDDLKELNRYHQIIGYKGKRGQIVKRREIK